jgi:hypothetical protein
MDSSHHAFAISFLHTPMLITQAAQRAFALSLMGM